MCIHVRVCSCKHAGGGLRSSLFDRHLILWDCLCYWIWSRQIQLNWLSGSPRNLPIPAFSTVKFIISCHYTWLLFFFLTQVYQGIDLKSSFLYSKCFTEWTISSTLNIYFKTYSHVYLILYILITKMLLIDDTW